MFRFEKELKAIGEGDLTKDIRLRRGDQITDMATSLNEAIASLHEKVLDIKKGVEQLIESASTQKAPERLIEELTHLHQRIESNFKI